MTDVTPSGQRVFAIAPTHYVFSTVYYDGTNGSRFLIDATAQDVVVFGSGLITASLTTTSAPAGFAYVQLASGGPSGDVVVVTKHAGQIAGHKA